MENIAYIKPDIEGSIKRIDELEKIREAALKYFGYLINHKFCK